MRKLLAALLFLVAGTASAATNWFVGPSAAGTGTCLTSAANNCTWTTLEGKAVVAGDTVTFDSGTYLVTLDPVWSGTSGNPITLACEVSGGCLIDTQGVRSGITVSGADWLDIEGFNVLGRSNGGAVSNVTASGGATHINFRKIRSVNASTRENRMCYSITGYTTTHILIEDSSAWGTCRKGIQHFGTYGPHTVRRFWIDYGGSEQSGPKMGLTAQYNSSNLIFENIIATWRATAVDVVDGNQNGTYSVYNNGVNLCSGGNSYCKTGYDLDQPSGILGIDQRNDSAAFTNRDADTYVYGSLFYLLSGADYHQATHLFSLSNLDDLHVEDVITYTEPGVAAFASKKGLTLSNCTGTTTGVTCNGGFKIAKDLTTVTGAAANTIQSQWTQTNVKTGTTMAAVYGANSIFSNTGSQGATLCKRWVDGVLTATNLFPWPESAQISAFRVATGFAAVDVDSEVEAVAGTTIPAGCGGGAIPTATPSNTPTNTFTRTNTATRTNTRTNTPTATRTSTNTPVPTNTPPGATFTPSNTPTNTFTPSNTPTDTATATATPTNTPQVGTVSRPHYELCNGRLDVYTEPYDPLKSHRHCPDPE